MARCVLGLLAEVGFRGLFDVARPGTIWGGLHKFRVVITWTICAAAFMCVVWTLRFSNYTTDPLFDTYLQMAGGLVAFTFAANALVRFRGTHDRVCLILAFGFVLAALVEAGTAMTAYHAVARADGALFTGRG